MQKRSRKVQSQPVKEVSFDTSARDHALIVRVVLRAISLMGEPEIPDDRLGLSMDITAVHCNGCTLDLERLLGFDDFNFRHDVAGIVRHIDRSTGELRDHFLPRCAAPEVAHA